MGASTIAPVEGDEWPEYVEIGHAKEKFIGRESGEEWEEEKQYANKFGYYFRKNGGD